MNALLSKTCSLASSCRLIFVIMLGWASAGIGQEPQQKLPAFGEPMKDIVFKPIEIRPSPNGLDYEGRFLFENKTDRPIELSVFEEPFDRLIKPAYVRFEVMNNGKWVRAEASSCGLALGYPIKPNRPYELFFDIDTLDEQDVPLTVRIGFENQTFWSESFVLDWKKDRETGRFASARLEHFQKLRDAFTRVGFKKEMVSKDDFCDQLFESMLKAMAVTQEGGLFPPTQEEIKDGLNLIPRFLLNGDIEIRFDYGKRPDAGPRYRVWFQMNPHQFNRTLFENNRTNQSRVFVRDGGDLVMMLELLEQDKIAEKALVMRIEYMGLKKESAVLAQSEANKTFSRVLDVFEGWLDKKPTK